jgi:hypothetical protein
MSTTKQIVIDTIGSQNNVPDSIIERAFADYGDDITPDDDYDPEYSKDIDRITIKVAKALIAVPKSISEGGYSIEYDKDGLMRLISSLSIANGLPDPYAQPKIRNKSYLW